MNENETKFSDLENGANAESIAGMQGELMASERSRMPSDCGGVAKANVSGNKVTPELLEVGDVAALLACSARTIYRLSDAGNMPMPVRIGRLVRWSHRALLGWISDGCRPIRNPGRPRQRHLQA